MGNEGWGSGFIPGKLQETERKELERASESLNNQRKGFSNEKKRGMMRRQREETGEGEKKGKEKGKEQ